MRLSFWNRKLTGFCWFRWDWIINHSQQKHDLSPTLDQRSSSHPICNLPDGQSALAYLLQLPVILIKNHPVDLLVLTDGQNIHEDHFGDHLSPQCSFQYRCGSL